MVLAKVFPLFSLPLLAAMVLIGNLGKRKDAETASSHVDAVDAVLLANHQVGYAGAYKKLFKSRNASELRALKNHPCSGLALGACWEEMRRNLPDNELARAKNIDAAHLKCFIGFCTDRLGIMPPAWWKDTILSAQAYSRSRISFTTDKSSLYRCGADGFFVPRDTELSKRRDSIVVEVSGKELIVLPDDGLLAAGKQLPVPSLSVNLNDKDRAYLAVHDQCCFTYILECIDRQRAKKLWDTDVWAGEGRVEGFCGAGFYHIVSILLVNNHVLVYGVGSDRAYIEGFRAENGAPLFRFSTSYHY